MKVLLVGTQVDHLGGGAAAALRQLAQGLKLHGVEVVIVSTHREPVSSQQQADGIRIYSFRPRNLYWIGDKDTQPPHKKALFQIVDIWNPQVRQALQAIIEHERPDIVHSHKLRGLSPSVWSAASRAGVTNLVHTCHDYELISPEGTLSGRLGRRAAEGELMMWPYQALRRNFSKAVRTVTAPSRFTLDRHIALRYFPKATPRVIPNSHGIGMDELAALRTVVETRAQHNDKTTPGRALYLGRLDPPKGIESLCTAFATAVAAHPSLHLDVAGWGTLLDLLKDRYRNIPQLVFHGPVEGEKKHELLLNADVVVIPSIWEEVFGIVIVEALAYGKPVIATSIGAIPELVIEGKTGHLVPPGDTYALADQLARVASSPHLFRGMTPACLDAAKTYTLESITAAYLAAYNSA